MQVGDLLTVTNGSWAYSPTSFTYQWQNSPDLVTWTNIAGANNQSYAVQLADRDLYIRCVVTAVSASGSAAQPSNWLGPVTDLAIVCQFSTANPNAAIQSWVDITAFVLSFHISRAKQRQLLRFEAGTMDLRLKNIGGEFDPTNPASPFYPNLLPMRQIRFGFVIDGVTYWVYTGYVERWPQIYRGPTWAEVAITCVDGFELVANHAMFTTPAMLTTLSSGAEELTYSAIVSAAYAIQYVRKLLSTPEATLGSVVTSPTSFGTGRSAVGWGNPVTVTLASPGVFTTAKPHGLSANDTVFFETSGALPTGLSADTKYFVLATGLTASSFQVSTSSGGAAVNTSGSQSGTHNVFFAVTMTNANPCVVTRTGHGLAAGDLLYFPDFGGGTLPSPLKSAQTPVFTNNSAVISCTGHGLSAGQQIFFTYSSAGFPPQLIPGLAVNTPYYVIATGLTANAFEVSPTPGGAAVVWSVTVNTTIPFFWATYAVIAAGLTSNTFEISKTVGGAAISTLGSTQSGVFAAGYASAKVVDTATAGGENFQLILAASEGSRAGATQTASYSMTTAQQAATVLNADATFITDILLTVLSAGAFLNQMALTRLVGGWPQQLTGAYIAEIFAFLSWQAQTLISAGTHLVQAQTIANDGATKALDQIYVASDTEDGQFFFDGSGRPVFYDQHDLVNLARNPVSAFFTDVPNDVTTFGYQELQVDWDKDLIYNDVRIDRLNGGSTQIADDSTSDSNYFTRTLSKSGLLNTSDADVLTLAQSLLARYKQPALRFEPVQFLPGLNIAFWKTLLLLELMDAVTIERHPPGPIRSFSNTVNVIGIDIVGNGGPVQNVVWTLNVDPSGIPANTFILDDATNGLLDACVLSY